MSSQPSRPDQRNDDDLTVDRERFVSSAAGYWREIREGSGVRATASTKAAEKIAAKWASRGRLQELLQILLTDASSEVRYAAAAELLTHGHGDVSLPVLQDLARSGPGLVRVTAKMLLVQRGYPLSDR